MIVDILILQSQGQVLLGVIGSRLCTRVYFLQLCEEGPQAPGVIDRWIIDYNLHSSTPLHLPRAATMQ